MRRFIVLAVGATAVGWVLNNLLRTDQDKAASSVMRPPLDQQAVGGSPRRHLAPDTSVLSKEDPNSDVVARSPEEDPGDPAAILPPEHAAPPEKPPNVIDLEPSQRRRPQKPKTADSPPAPTRQNAKTRIRRARNAVDERFRTLPEKGHRGKRSTA